MEAASKRGTRVALALAALTTAALALAFVLAAPGEAQARTLEAPIGVADDITRVRVAKVDASTHDALEGATLQIYRKDDPSSPVDTWVSDGTVHELAKGLDVDVVYVLHEASAPEGYAPVGDVEFVVDPIEGVGIHVLSEERADYEFTGTYTLTLLDPREGEEVVEYRTRPAPREDRVRPAETDSDAAPKTGDTLDATPFLAAGGVALVALVALLLARPSGTRRRGDD